MVAIVGAPLLTPTISLIVPSHAGALPLAPVPGPEPRVPNARAAAIVEDRIARQ